MEVLHQGRECMMLGGGGEGEREKIMNIVKGSTFNLKSNS